MDELLNGGEVCHVQLCRFHIALHCRPFKLWWWCSASVLMCQDFHMWSHSVFLTLHRLSGVFSILQAWTWALSEVVTCPGSQRKSVEEGTHNWNQTPLTPEFLLVLRFHTELSVVLLLGVTARGMETSVEPIKGNAKPHCPDTPLLTRQDPYRCGLPKRFHLAGQLWWTQAGQRRYRELLKLPWIQREKDAVINWQCVHGQRAWKLPWRCQRLLTGPHTSEGKQHQL